MRDPALCLVLLVLAVNLIVAENIVSYENPIRSSADDEIKSLPYLNEAITFRHYSGYLKADKIGKNFLHYWFVEATDDPTNKPVLLWLNGGPGCSSMEGLFSELGPFEATSDGKKIKLRSNSWNKLANVIFIESPAGVGYSYSKKHRNTETDDSTANENYLALKSFYEKFPQYKNNPLYLSGESYAGVYLPTLGVLVDADKKFNLKGIAICNGYLDDAKLEESLIYFAYYHGLVGKTDWDNLSAVCCDGKPPARGNCPYMNGPNVTYDCRHSVDLVLLTVTHAPGLNPYNLYGDCPMSNLSRMTTGLNGEDYKVSRRSIDMFMRKVFSEHKLGNQDKPFEVLNLNQAELAKLSDVPPCFDDDYMVRYMNDPVVRDAIHIPKELGSWGVCSNINYAVKYPIQSGGLSPQINKLIDSSRKLALIIFNGDTDLVCNALGDEWFVDDLGRKVIIDYKPWKVDNQVAGFVKHYDGISFATVRGAGHMVPEFKPREGFELIKVFLNSTSHNVLL